MQKEAFFPAELWQDLPHITLTGGQLLHIEQHHGMVSYQPNQIVFDTSRGMLTVMANRCTCGNTRRPRRSWSDRSTLCC